MKITHEGKEIEVLTPEEVSAKITEVEAKGKQTLEETTSRLNTEWQEKVDNKESDLVRAQNEKKTIEEQIAKGGEQGANFKILKDALDKKDADILGLQNSLKAIEDTRFTDFRNGITTKLANGDKEVEKKILHHFDETLKSLPGKTQEEIVKKLESAYKLSINNETPNIFESVMVGSGGRGLPLSPTNGVEFSSREKQLGAKMGITDDDYKKFGPRLKNK